MEREIACLPDGGAPRRLTSGERDEDLDGWSRDGKWVYFESFGSQGQEIWKTSIEGGHPVLVAKGGWGPVESRDGTSLFYNGPENSIWKISATGTPPVRMLRDAWRPMESEDAKTIYYSGPGSSIWKIPATGGTPTLVRTIGSHASWTLGSDGIYVLNPDDKGGPAIELLPFNSVRPGIVRLAGKPESYGI